MIMGPICGFIGMNLLIVGFIPLNFIHSCMHFAFVVAFGAWAFRRSLAVPLSAWLAPTKKMKVGPEEDDKWGL